MLVEVSWLLADGAPCQVKMRVTYKEFVDEDGWGDEETGAPGEAGAPGDAGAPGEAGTPREAGTPVSSGTTGLTRRTRRTACTGEAGAPRGRLVYLGRQACREKQRRGMLFHQRAFLQEQLWQGVVCRGVLCRGNPGRTVVGQRTPFASPLPSPGLPADALPVHLHTCQVKVRVTYKAFVEDDGWESEEDNDGDGDNEGDGLWGSDGGDERGSGGGSGQQGGRGGSSRGAGGACCGLG